MKPAHYLLCIFLLFSNLSHANSGVIKILPLGDSISCASTQKLSYRYPLWRSLVDRGKRISFVGSQGYNGGRSWKSYKGLNFPVTSEGHSGWRADQILRGLKNGTGGLSHWLGSYNPDIALIHLGTNDLYQSQSPESTIKDIEKIILLLRKKNPKIKILLAKIIPMGKNGHHVSWFNQLIGQLAIKLNKKNSPVHSVDMYSVMNFNKDMERDHIHPNARGEKKIANQWLLALINYHYL